jgi:toxin HigB-1
MRFAACLVFTGVKLVYPWGRHINRECPGLPFLRHIEYRYSIYGVAIQLFRCSDTRDLHFRKRVPRFVNIEAVARRKLGQLDAAHLLQDLASPPGNRLEALDRDRKGQHSIRINGQWRVCFVWTPQGPTNVEIVDYH